MRKLAPRWRELAHRDRLAAEAFLEQPDAVLDGHVVSYRAAYDAARGSAGAFERCAGELDGARKREDAIVAAAFGCGMIFGGVLVWLVMR